MDRTLRAVAAPALSLLLAAPVLLTGCDAERTPSSPSSREATFSGLEDGRPGEYLPTTPPGQNLRRYLNEELPYTRLTQVSANATADLADEEASLPMLVLPALPDEQIAPVTDAFDSPVSTAPVADAPTSPVEFFELHEEDAAANQIRATDEPAELVPAEPDFAPITPIVEEPSPTASGSIPTTEPLPWGGTTPSSELSAIAQRAEETARRGYDLAERGALFSARAQFIAALRDMAQAIDLQRGTNAHGHALASGLRALTEVNDFVPRGTRMERDLNLKLIVDSHRTPVLKNRSLEKVSLAEAQRLYLSYAHEQLVAAAGDQPVCSLALHGLGKVCAAPAGMHGPKEQIAEAKSVVYFQAALTVEPKNFMAANELGVLLARFGRLPEARAVLEHAVATSVSPVAWRNLAAVHTKLGDDYRATQAKHQADAAVARLQQAGQAAAGAAYPVNILTPEEFARSNSMVRDAQAPGTPTPAKPVSVPETAAKPKKSSWFSRK